MANSFSKFGSNFQEKLVVLIAMDHQFADQMNEVLELDFFELEHHKILVHAIYEYQKQYIKYPSLDAIATIAYSSEDLSQLIKNQIGAFLSKLSKTKSVEDAEYIKNESLNFCKNKKLEKAIYESAKILANGEDYARIRTLIEDASKAGIDFNAGHDFINDFDERYTDDARGVISTGFDELDAVCKGGLGKGEVFVAIAPTGVGKSFLCVHCGATAMMLGKNVVHYTLELSAKATGVRYDCKLSEISLNEVMSRKDEVLAKIKQVPGKLIIKEYPGRSITIDGLRAHLEKLRTINEFIPDMVVVDYGDLIKFQDKVESERFGLQSNFEGLRTLAQEFGFTVVTATQTNRTGLKAEVVTMDAISEAYNKCFNMDMIVGLSRTIKDRATKTGRLYVAKNRNGEDGMVFPMTINLEYGEFKLLPRETGDALARLVGDGNAELSTKDLKKKYLDFKNLIKEEENEQ